MLGSTFKLQQEPMRFIRVTQHLWASARTNEVHLCCAAPLSFTFQLVQT